MYEQVSHSLLNDIMTELKPDIKSENIRHFYTRLGANFFSIYTLFHYLYGDRDDFRQQAQRLVETMARQYILRPDALKHLDIERERDHNWFLNQQWAGMALYSDGFAGDLKTLTGKVPYFQDLGVNMVHVMPIMACPSRHSDGGYAVSNYREIDQRVGAMEDLDNLAQELRQRDILLTLDVVLNHTSDEHEWALRAKQGEERYQDYYYVFPNREIPDMFEQTMPEIFPDTAPGNFTWIEGMDKWVMTVFKHYQWDLNYNNPAVFIEMMDIILFWANHGADIVRLDAVAFLWKKIGSTCQNEREAHLILQLMKDCCQVTAPGVLFIAEAIVAPVEVAKYFGEDAINAKECEVAYNATFMALLWDAVATKSARLLNQGIKSLPDKLERATWLNYIRCHDDIGLGFDDTDIRLAGYDPIPHRRYLIDYFTGQYADSFARGMPFGHNAKTGDARISGSLASLVGLEVALERGDPKEIDDAIKVIILLHGMIMSFGGIPLLYYGDEIGTTNDYRYVEDERKSGDTRWMHRPTFDWEKAELRNKHNTIENRIFQALKKMIAVRKETPAFADFNNRELRDSGNPHLFSFCRIDPHHVSDRVLIVGNFDARPQHMEIDDIIPTGFVQQTQLYDLYSGEKPAMFKNALVIPSYRFYWLQAR
ncbi:MAG: alpha-amylase [Gammaproteobacteria bacterium]|nr:alpha-amylase family protein [Gammaproteobacteria bacterium]NNJ96552.1 alpha-amylase [Gammaproteobacteria bacterium]